MDKHFYLLTSKDKLLKFGIYLEETECGIVGIVNFHFNPTEQYEILLTDENEENFYTVMDSNPYSFALPENFVLTKDVLIDIFCNNVIIASTSNITEEIKNEPKTNSKSDEDYLSEADYFIKKAQKIFSNNKEISASKNKELFFDTIKNDFDMLFDVGDEDYLLSKKFKNSVWRKVDFSGEVYILGKIYAGSSVVGEELPSFIAIAEPTTLERSKNSNNLGEYAKFYHANIYDSFGFLVLIENAVTGKPVSLKS